ncbi:hypothetical protein R5R35_002577 [Gryllus longicercus]|uniref:Protein sleepless n=1 Tax=Gryllus longicercus TaxID=2509291 RepID=A0AAN9VSP3_9ORTH
MVGAKCMAAGAVLLVALAVSWTPTGEALSCYECNSHADPLCAESTPPETLKKDCSEKAEGRQYTLCRKIVQHIEFEVNGNKPEQRVIRSCGWENSTYLNRCYQRSGFGGRQEVCSCTTDNCNGAPHLPVLPALSLVAGVTALYRLVF